MEHLRESIVSLLEYMWKDEQKHWEECEKPQNHIYCDLRILRDNFDLQEKYPNE